MIKILLIEDDAIVRLNISDYLKSIGFCVIEAGDGESGLKILTNQLPDLVVCDVHLPKISGFQVLELVRQNPEIANIRFIFFSSCNSQSSYRKALQLGANDFLDKSVQECELLEAIYMQIRPVFRSGVA